MNDTFIPSSDYATKKWYIIDASQKPLGRISTVVASVLQGKHKVDYHPSIDMGDYVIVINAETMHLDSWTVGHPKYRAYSPGRPGSSLKIFFEKIYISQKKGIFNALKNSEADSVIKFKEVLSKIINGKN